MSHSFTVPDLPRIELEGTLPKKYLCASGHGIMKSVTCVTIARFGARSAAYFIISYNTFIGYFLSLRMGRLARADFINDPCKCARVAHVPSFPHLAPTSLLVILHTFTKSQKKQTDDAGTISELLSSPATFIIDFMPAHI